MKQTLALLNKRVLVSASPKQLRIVSFGSFSKSLPLARQNQHCQTLQKCEISTRFYSTNANNQQQESVASDTSKISNREEADKESFQHFTQLVSNLLAIISPVNKTLSPAQIQNNWQKLVSSLDAIAQKKRSSSMDAANTALTASNVALDHLIKEFSSTLFPQYFSRTQYKNDLVALGLLDAESHSSSHNQKDVASLSEMIQKITTGIVKAYYQTVYNKAQGASPSVKECNNLIVYLKQESVSSKFGSAMYLVYFIRSLARLSIMDIRLTTEDLVTSHSMFSKFPNTVLHLCFVHLCKKEAEAANQHFQELLEMDAEHKDEYYRDRGIFYLQTLTNSQKALEDFNQALMLNPQNLLAHYHKGRILYEQAAADAGNEAAVGGSSDMYAKFKDSIQEFEMCLKIDPLFQSGIAYLAFVYFELGLADKALELYQQLLTLSPMSVDAHMRIGQIYLEFKKDYEKATQSLQKALELNPKHAMSIYLLGVVYERKAVSSNTNQSDLFIKALECFDKSLAIDAKNYEALNERGLLHMVFFNIAMSRKDTKQSQEMILIAVQDFSKALALYANHYQILSNRGYALMIMNKNNEALQDFNRSLQINPNYVTALSNRSVLYAKMDQPEKAITDANKAISLQPNDNPSLYLRRALICRAIPSMNQQASHDIQRAKEIADKLGVPLDFNI